MKHFVYADSMAQHAFPTSIPFVLARASMLHRQLEERGMLAGPQRQVIAPQPLTLAEAEAFHHPAYLEALAVASAGQIPATARSMGLMTADTPIFEGMLDTLRLYAGGSLIAAANLMAGNADVAFHAGGGFHHAHAGRASGFCYINDVALAILRFRQAGWRVAYLDIDAHHGDGVQYAFDDEPEVLTVSLHQDPLTLFPGTGFVDEVGIGRGVGTCVNLPLPPGSDDHAFMRAFQAVALPVMHAFAPDVLVLELGMDALLGDPLANLSLSNRSHVAVIEALKAFERPLLVVGGGGYHIDNTVRGWALAWAALCGDLRDPSAAAHAWMDTPRDRNVAHQAGLARVDAQVERTIAEAQARLFPRHGLTPTL